MDKEKIERAREHEALIIKDFETLYDNRTSVLAKRYRVSEVQIDLILNRYFAEKKNFKKLR